MESRRMGFFEHLEELKKRLMRIFVVFLAFFAVFVTFSIRFVDVGGLAIPYLWPDFFNSISVQVIGLALDYYLPDFVTAVQIAPAEAILVQFKVAMFLALVTAMPVIVYQLSRFIAPGLYEREKKVILKITVPATLLFLSGVLISHFLILPFVFDFLYTIGLNIGFVPLARADPVFDVALLFFLGMGLAFQTPVIMWGLSSLGLVDPQAYKTYWRYAVIGFFLFGAVITPDGSGITMMLVAVPMSVLYVIGYLLAVRAWRRNEGPEEPEEKGAGTPRTVVWSAVILVGAVIVGVVYVGSPLFFAPETGTPIGSGTFDVALPAFVIYSPTPLTPEMQTGGALTMGEATAVTFDWSAVASDGTAVTLEFNGTPSGAFDASSGGSRMVVLPTKWTGDNLTSLHLATSGGNAGLYALNLSMAYTAYDVGGRLVLSYDPAPLSASFVPLAQTPFGPPLPSERDEFDRGRFTSPDPNWELGVSLDALRMRNDTYTFEFPATEISLPGRSVTLSVNRSFVWSTQESLDLWVRGAAGADFGYTWYVDTRFGSIYPGLELP